jgi:hypothetical protein
MSKYRDNKLYYIDAKDFDSDKIIIEHYVKDTKTIFKHKYKYSDNIVASLNMYFDSVELRQLKENKDFDKWNNMYLPVKDNTVFTEVRNAIYDAITEYCDKNENLSEYANDIRAINRRAIAKQYVHLTSKTKIIKLGNKSNNYVDNNLTLAEFHKEAYDNFYSTEKFNYECDMIINFSSSIKTFTRNVNGDTDTSVYYKHKAFCNRVEFRLNTSYYKQSLVYDTVEECPIMKPLIV